MAESLFRDFADICRDAGETGELYQDTMMHGAGAGWCLDGARKGFYELPPVCRQKILSRHNNGIYADSLNRIATFEAVRDTVYLSV